MYPFSTSSRSNNLGIGNTTTPRRLITQPILSQTNRLSNKNNSSYNRNYSSNINTNTIPNTRPNPSNTNQSKQISNVIEISELERVIQQKQQLICNIEKSIIS